MAEKPLTPAERVERAFADLDPFCIHAGEVLVQWIEDNSNGQVALIRFNEDKHPLKDLLINGDGKMQTRVVHIVIIERDERGEPVHQERAYQLRNATLKGGKMCQRFHILKSDVEFHRFLFAERNVGDLAGYATHEARTEYVETLLRKELLKGQTSKLLDHEPQLRTDFLDNYWRPFQAWRDARQIDAGRQG